MTTKLKEALEREFVLFFDDAPNSVAASPTASLTPLPRRGVSLAWLRSLAACLEDEGMLQEDSSTRYVVSKVLMPLVKKQWGSNGQLWNALPSSQVGPPNFYVIHSWGGDFIDLVTQLCEELAPRDLKHKGQPWIESHNNSLPSSYSSIFVWLDFLSINHQASNVPAMSPGEPSQFDVDLMRSAILSCSEGAVFVLDPDLHILSRSWCLMEVFQVCYMLEPGKLQVAFPWADSNDELMPFDFPAKFIAAVSNTDILHSECFRPDDKAKIIAQTKQGLGVKRTQDILISGLLKATRATLRWGTLSHFFYYCALLIQSGELSLLFTILANVPEIQEEDSSSLEEIKDIFQTFDETRSGRLLEDAFIRVLGCAGYTIREAVEVYEAISGQDGREGVGIDEFTGWWAGSQKEKVESGLVTPKITGDGFCKMISGLCVFLERKKLIPHATYLRNEVARIKGLPDSPLGPRMHPPPFHGDWSKFVSKMSWMLHNDDIKAAAKLIHEFIVENADSIRCKIQQVPLPPSFSPHGSRVLTKNVIGSTATLSAGAPSSSNLSRLTSAGLGRRIVRGGKMQRLKDLQLTMRTYLEFLVGILRWHPDLSSLMTHLSKTAQEFLDMAAMTSRSMESRFNCDSEDESESEEEEEGEGERDEGRTPRRNSRSGRRKGRGKSTPRDPGGDHMKKEGGKSPYKDWYNFNLISDMVHLKYSDGAVSQDRIKEAGNALSQWMAGRRAGGAKEHASKASLSNLKESYMVRRPDAEMALPSLADPTGSGGKRDDDDRWNNLKALPTGSPRSMGGSKVGGGTSGGMTPRQIMMGGRGTGGDKPRPLVPELPLGTSYSSPNSPRSRTQGLSFADDPQNSDSPRGLPMQSPRSMTLGSRLTMSRLVLPVTPRSGAGGMAVVSSDREDNASPRASKKAPIVPPLQLSSLRSSKASLPSIQAHQGPSSSTEAGLNSARSVGFGELYSQDDEDTPSGVTPSPDPPLSARLPATRTKSSLLSSASGLGIKIKGKATIAGVDLSGPQSHGGSPKEKSLMGEYEVEKRKRLLSQLSTIMQLSQLSQDANQGDGIE